MNHLNVIKYLLTTSLSFVPWPLTKLAFTPSDSNSLEFHKFLRCNCSRQPFYLNKTWLTPKGLFRSTNGLTDASFYLNPDSCPSLCYFFILTLNFEEYHKLSKSLVDSWLQYHITTSIHENPLKFPEFFMKHRGRNQVKSVNVLAEQQIDENVLVSGSLHTDS